MDRAISASEANQRFSEMLRDVAEGESFTVVSRGRPVARVLPIDRDEERAGLRNGAGLRLQHRDAGRERRIGCRRRHFPGVGGEFGVLLPAQRGRAKRDAVMVF